MPHRVGYLFGKIATQENVQLAWEVYNKKRKVELRKEYDEEIAREILEKLLACKASFGKPRKKIIGDGNRKRCLLIPDFKGFIAQNAVANILVPILDKRINGNSFASRKGLGSHRCAAKQSRFISTHQDQAKFHLYFDIRKCYNHISHEDVIATVRRIIKDEKVVALVEDILANGGEAGVGLPMGFPMSPIFANLLLDGLYRRLVEVEGVTKVYVYMDNFGVYANTKTTLKHARLVAVDWLLAHGMEMKHDWQIFHVSLRAVRTCGFLVGGEGKPRVYREIAKKTFKNIDQFNSHPSQELAQSLVGRVGWIKQTNRTHILRERIKWSKVKKFLSK